VQEKGQGEKTMNSLWINE